MKKICSFLCVLALVFVSVNAFAETEIMFNSVPWLSDKEEAIQIIAESGYANKDCNLEINQDNILYFVPDELLDYQPTSLSKYNISSFSTEIPGSGKIAGCPVRKLVLSFAYDGSYRLISVRVELIGVNYDGLKEKLEKVYGMCETVTLEEEGIISNMWKGTENSAVQLYTESEGQDYILMYGRLDATEILTNCQTVDPDDVSGL